MNKHDSRKVFSARFTDLIRRKFNEISTVFTEMTDVDIIEKIIRDSENLSNSDDLEDLRAANEQLQLTIDSQTEELQALIQQMNDSKHNEVDSEHYIKTIEEKDNLIGDLKLQVLESVNTANENARLLQAYDLEKTQPKPGQYIVILGDVADELLQLTQKRLEEKLQKKITPGQILSDLFVKYTVEQPCDFAYPILINKTEIKVIIDRYKK